jgi:hypothetical protein
MPDVLKIPIYALNRSAGAFEPIKLKVKFITNFKTFFGYLGLLEQKFVNKNDCTGLSYLLTTTCFFNHYLNIFLEKIEILNC